MIVVLEVINTTVISNKHRRNINSTYTSKGAQSSGICRKIHVKTCQFRPGGENAENRERSAHGGIETGENHTK